MAQPPAFLKHQATALQARLTWKAEGWGNVLSSECCCQTAPATNRDWPCHSCCVTLNLRGAWPPKPWLRPSAWAGAGSHVD